MNPFERRNAIREIITDQHSAQVSVLSKALGVSEVSVRRDLVLLEQEGLINRIHGAAVLAESYAGGRPFALKVKMHAREKRAIGGMLAGLITPGEHVILHAGSSVLEVARALRNDAARPDSRITVITGSPPVIELLGHRPGFDVMVVGGLYLPVYETVVGPQASDTLRTLNVDKFVTGTDGVSIERGITTDLALNADFMRECVRAARETIVVADSTKIEKTGFVSALPLSAIHTFVTDSGAPTAFLRQLAELGIRVMVAQIDK